MPPILNVVPFVSVDNTMKLVLATGVERFLTELAAVIEEDFRRWPVFDKTPRVASHSQDGPGADRSRAAGSAGRERADAGDHRTKRRHLPADVPQAARAISAKAEALLSAFDLVPPCSAGGVPVRAGAARAIDPGLDKRATVQNIQNVYIPIGLDMIDPLSAKFAALADPTRRAMLARLASSELTLADLARPLEMTVPAVAKHLAVLERAGFVTRSRPSTSVARPAQLQVTAFSELADWIEKCRVHWEGSFDRLAAYLETPEARGPEDV